MDTVCLPLFPGPQATSTFLPLLGGCSRYTCPDLSTLLPFTDNRKLTSLRNREPSKLHQLIQRKRSDAHQVLVQRCRVLRIDCLRMFSADEIFASTAAYFESHPEDHEA